ncbi:hypothetical protein JOC75_004043 [Metabacillus crassostreae]|uniref:DUF6906 family protein n=1 Tax=Metabacillus crassostreae TaxID=929098 RepID=UPI00195894A4|nr:hypothetical protein [Metabacillus crassostreae]MBM7606015.1 hypothetical protein [Metabacillus crassostreae]
MKQGKRPTREQKKLLVKSGLNPNNWLIEKNLKHDHKLHLVHRETGTPRVVVV